ncbi:sulfotransferase family protein [Leisingera aquimarina]|uniref:sulfotransferase family protein n=1 Tax=Leisingera aquimarina TaxID=476529 RepID=UPI00040AD21D|nr:sulfotransferase [Leisingera aquimarina]
MPQHLFLSGTARAGTSALVNILNQHNHILIGQERYFKKFRQDRISPAHFEKDRFLDIREGDTHAHGGLFVPQRPRRYDNAVYVGDKYPPMFRHLDHVLSEFPKARHIYILRNPLSVAESYEARFRNPDDDWTLDWRAGLAAWNDSVARIAALTQAQLQQFTFVQYEDIYASPQAINALFTRLGLSNLEPETLAPFAEKFAGLNSKLVPRRDDIRAQVAREADWAAYKQLCALMPPPLQNTVEDGR